MTHARLPQKSVRDLIGIVRSLYFVWQARGVAATRLDELVQVGRDLRDALELSQRTEPGSMGHRAAWQKAERATAALGTLIDAEELARPIVQEAARRARGR